MFRLGALVEGGLLNKCKFYTDEGKIYSYEKHRRNRIAIETEKTKQFMDLQRSNLKFLKMLNCFFVRRMQKATKERKNL